MKTAPISSLTRRFLHDGSYSVRSQHLALFLSLLCAFWVTLFFFTLSIAAISMANCLLSDDAGPELDDYTQFALSAASPTAVPVPGFFPTVQKGTKTADFAPCPDKNAANTLVGGTHHESIVESVFEPKSPNSKALHSLDNILPLACNLEEKEV